MRISKAKGLFEKGHLPNWSEELFEVSKSLKSYRKRRGIKEYFVKWLGYPEKFDCWVTGKYGFLPLSSK